MCGLASGAIACGDDDDLVHADAGPDSGAMSGRGGNGGMSGGGSGAVPSMAECVGKSMTASMGVAIAPECLACVCEHGPREVVACNATCWSLVTCYALNCADAAPNSSEAEACAVDNCQDFVAQSPAAEALSKIVDPMCLSECVVESPSDAGTDAATEMDAGG